MIDPKQSMADDQYHFSVYLIILCSAPVYLCDSGGQYIDGTTDVTRTLHFGTPSAEEIHAFTRVLQGHIAIDMMQIPVTALGCNGYRLDALARQFLWEDGLDYRHGTGHGVGSYLNVHEGYERKDLATSRIWLKGNFFFLALWGLA